LKESMSQVLPAVEAVGAQIQQAMSELAQEVQEVAGMRKQSLGRLGGVRAVSFCRPAAYCFHAFGTRLSRTSHEEQYHYLAKAQWVGGPW
jgi:hypothetical protein